jgi:hypothetical protein
VTYEGSPEGRVSGKLLDKACYLSDKRTNEHRSCAGSVRGGGDGVGGAVNPEEGYLGIEVSLLDRGGGGQAEQERRGDGGLGKEHCDGDIGVAG